MKISEWKETSRPRRQRGVSLVEVAVATAVLGVCGMATWNFIERQNLAQRDRQVASMVTRAQDALLAFAYLHGHLPCPAPSPDGRAKCGKDSGYLPYLTLGLPAREAATILYRVPVQVPALTVSGAGAYSVVVGQPEGKFGDIAPRTTTLAAAASDRQEGLYDFCAALGGSGNDKLAYELSIVADEGSTSASVVGTSPGGIGRTHVLVGRSTLATRLGCAPLSAAVRAQFNAALGGQIMARAMRDYRDQFELGYHTYAADLAQGVFFAANAVYTTTRAVTKMTVAKAEAEGTALLHSAPFVESVVAVAASGIYGGAMASNVARFATNLITAQTRRETIKALTASTQATATEIGQRAVSGATRQSFGITSP